MHQNAAPSLSAHHPVPFVAALAFEIELNLASDARALAPLKLKVLPDGAFDAVDGRPGSLEGVTAKQWLMNAAAAQDVMAAFQARRLKLVIDYEHQTLRAEKNGQPAPAAAWINALSYEAGKGLIADVEWTDTAAAMVAGKEYRYLSPVFLFHPETGAVQALHSVALTNVPGLNNLGEIAEMAALSAAGNPDLKRRASGPDATNQEVTTMDKTQVLAALNLPADTSDTTALAALGALPLTLAQKEQEIAALKANQFDPAKHIPLDEHKKVTEQLTALQAAQDQAAHEALITAALSDARILPANEGYWRAQPLAALQAFLKDAKPLMAALTATQTGGKAPAAATGPVAALSSEEQYAVTALGLDAAAFVKAKA